MRKLNQKIDRLTRTTEIQPELGEMPIRGCSNGTVVGLRRLVEVGGEAAAMIPCASVGLEPAADEGVRLIRAFRRVADPRQRQWLIDQAEALAKR